MATSCARQSSQRRVAEPARAWWCNQVRSSPSPCSFFLSTSCPCLHRAHQAHHPGFTTPTGVLLLVETTVRQHGNFFTSPHEHTFNLIVKQKEARDRTCTGELHDLGICPCRGETVICMVSEQFLHNPHSHVHRECSSSCRFV